MAAESQSTIVVAAEQTRDRRRRQNTVLEIDRAFLALPLPSIHALYKALGPAPAPVPAGSQGARDTQIANSNAPNSSSRASY